MKIIRADHLGMCFGVRDAIALAKERAGVAPLTACSAAPASVPGVLVELVEPWALHAESARPSAKPQAIGARDENGERGAMGELLQVVELRRGGVTRVTRASQGQHPRASAGRVDFHADVGHDRGGVGPADRTRLDGDRSSRNDLE